MPSSEVPQLGFGSGFKARTGIMNKLSPNEPSVFLRHPPHHPPEGLLLQHTFRTSLRISKETNDVFK